MKNSATKLINKSDIRKAIKMDNWMGNIVASAAMKLMGLNYINKIYSDIAEYSGIDFTRALIDKFGVKYDIDPTELENIPKEGAFITVSNHPFGGWDGILLYNTIASVRPDFKIIANFILSSIPNLKDCFLAVNPFENNKKLTSSFSGIKSAYDIIKNGGALGIFPAGEVSTYYGKNKFTADKEWSHSILKLIKNCNVPVIPIYFDGTNSNKFHRLGKIHPMLRTVNLPNELIKKSGETIIMKIGTSITLPELQHYQTTVDLGNYLRNRVYALEANTKLCDSCKQSMLSLQPITGRPSQILLDKDLKYLNENSFLFQVSKYKCYLAETEEIPNVFIEIGRKREESFREVGEGTGHSIDIDKYDDYYRHLILWDIEGNKLAGAYRVGIGKEIMEKFGPRGFYTNTLFEFSDKFVSLLPESIELGRSFLSSEYKKETLPLMLLIKGLLYTVTRYKGYKYLFGPASISSWFPIFYRSLLVYGLSTTLKEKYANLVIPKNPFIYDFLRTDISILLKEKCNNIDFLDKYIQKLSNDRFRVPTLFKKYSKLNADVLTFNVDKDFNNCVDGMIFLNLDNVPKREVAALTKGSENPEELLERFKDNKH